MRNNLANSIDYAIIVVEILNNKDNILTV